MIAGMGADGLDPIEPPPQGDMELRDVRQRHGRQLVLFGNLEIADIETLPTPRFTEKVKRCSTRARRAGDAVSCSCPPPRPTAAKCRR